MSEPQIEIYRLRSTGVVIGADGSDLGRVGEMYLDEAGIPAWVTVKTGWFDTRECFVPMAGARIDGDEIHVPFDKETMKAAPHFAADTVLTPDDEIHLHQHYGVDATGDDADGDDASRRGVFAAVPTGHPVVSAAGAGDQNDGSDY